jgi:hypothetical protein
MKDVEKDTANPILVIFFIKFYILLFTINWTKVSQAISY